MCHTFALVSKVATVHVTVLILVGVLESFSTFILARTPFFQTRESTITYFTSIWTPFSKQLESTLDKIY